MQEALNEVHADQDEDCRSAPCESDKESHGRDSSYGTSWSLHRPDHTKELLQEDVREFRVSK